ncbi:c-type cytochrome [Sedimenticola selenatireducens]|uniref:c-type cytochrome n=1 Tax=Sedimenticola selenatireducens TaxID=191960 RepID=UPI00056253A5|nr:cytochrome c [Sedimenticola selenatireducens]
MTIPILLTACDVPGPEARRQALHLPPPGFKGIVEKGIEPFEKYCMVCHGVKGRGTDQGPPLIDRVYRPDHHADLSFHIAVRDGVKSHHWRHGDMQPIPLITPEETEHIVAYIREEQRRVGIE